MPPRRRAQVTGFRADIPEFNGGLQADEFLEDVSRAVQTLQRRGRARAQWEAPKDWETHPIYDEYDEDEDWARAVFDSGKALVFAKQNPKSPNYFDRTQSNPSQHAMAILSEFIDEEKPTKPVSPPRPFNAVLEPEKPLGVLEAAFDFVSRESDLFKSDSVISFLVDVNLQRRRNPIGERSIGHGKIRGRIFSNKGRMMEAHEAHERKCRISTWDQSFPSRNGARSKTHCFAMTYDGSRPSEFI